ncbi:MAG: flagellar basal body-associated FliL family protein [Deltaproteobacteria bacterium]|nr:flagellar basal body-associated FliL family protein [Deltaproteobacteria bacterium]
MADDKEKASTDETIEESQEVKKGSLKKLIILVVLLVFLGGGGFAGWKFYLQERLSNPEEDQTQQTAEAAIGPSVMLKMEPFIVNLLDQEGKRYLKAQFEVELDSEEKKQALEEHMAQIRDAVLLLLSSKTFAQIGVPEGKIQLRAELIERINTIMKSGGVRGLYFTEFVIQ